MSDNTAQPIPVETLSPDAYPPDRKAWGVDISDAQWPFSLQPLKDQGASFAVVKVSMGRGISIRHKMHIQNVRDAGLKLGVYHWVDPTAPLREQVFRFTDQINQWKPDFIAADNEQWWADWTAFAKYNRHEISQALVPKLDPKKISQFGKEFMYEVAAIVPGLTFYNYTARWFVQGYSPQMITWINDFPVWLAGYIPQDGQPLSWVEFFRIIDHLQNPVSFKGLNSWRMWQIISRTVLPGMKNNLDVDIYHGNVYQFLADIGEGQIPLPDIPPPATDYQLYQVIALYLNIRTSKPGGSYRVAGYYNFGENVRIYETSDGWGRVSENEERWVNLKWLKKLKM